MRVLFSIVQHARVFLLDASTNLHVHTCTHEHSLARTHTRITVQIQIVIGTVARGCGASGWHGVHVCVACANATAVARTRVSQRQRRRYTALSVLCVFDTRRRGGPCPPRQKKRFVNSTIRKRTTTEYSNFDHHRVWVYIAVRRDGDAERTSATATTTSSVNIECTRHCGGSGGDGE